jgi:hypothetical protein
MNEQNLVVAEEPVEITIDEAEKLFDKIATELEQKGRVVLQGEDEVGGEYVPPQTVTDEDEKSN